MRSALLTNSAVASAQAVPSAASTALAATQNTLATAGQRAAQQASQAINRVLSTEKEIETRNRKSDPSFEDRGPDANRRGPRPSSFDSAFGESARNLIAVA